MGTDSTPTSQNTNRLSFQSKSSIGSRDDNPIRPRPAEAGYLPPRSMEAPMRSIGVMGDSPGASATSPAVARDSSGPLFGPSHGRVGSTDALHSPGRPLAPSIGSSSLSS